MLGNMTPHIDSLPRQNRLEPLHYFPRKKIYAFVAICTKQDNLQSEAFGHDALVAEVVWQFTTNALKCIETEG